MTKTFDHAVIYNGVLYSANTPIEFAEPKEESEKEIVEDKEPEKEVTANDKSTGRKSGTGDKDNK